MRINQYIAKSTGISRRKADQLIFDGRVKINDAIAEISSKIKEGDSVYLDNELLTINNNSTTMLLNKPPGYIVSRDGQGGKTIYQLLPIEYHRLKAIGRLDKDSSGLILLTDDGQLAQSLTHPKYQKTKIYQVKLNKDLAPLHQQMISEYGISLEDGVSRLQLSKIDDENSKYWQITMKEGRNRQIRRTFNSLNYDIIELHRIKFGDYDLLNLSSGQFKII